MCPKVGLIREGLGTLWAFERLLSCMGPNMTLKEPRSAEALAAVRAYTALAMRADVHAERRHGDIHFVTVRTLPGFLVIDIPMDLSMSSQVTRGTVPLSTFLAMVHLTKVDLIKYLIDQGIKAIEAHSFISWFL